jgi:transcription elongation factor Elf1
MKTIKCRVCGHTKPVESFYKESRAKSGYQSQCKECKKQIDQESRKKTGYYEKYQKSPDFVFAQLKYQAKKRNIVFDLSEVSYHENLAHKPCFYCGEEDTKYWVDRYINDHSVGYTIENTVPCCEMCNKMKSHLLPENFLSHCRKVVQHNS